eukprot:5631407-Alexandrium_andersonii.AAC.1
MVLVALALSLHWAASRSAVGGWAGVAPAPATRAPPAHALVLLLVPGASRFVRWRCACRALKRPWATCHWLQVSRALGDAGISLLLLAAGALPLSPRPFQVGARVG